MVNVNFLFMLLFQPIYIRTGLSAFVTDAGTLSQSYLARRAQIKLSRKPALEWIFGIWRNRSLCRYLCEYLLVQRHYALQNHLLAALLRKCDLFLSMSLIFYIKFFAYPPSSFENELVAQLTDVRASNKHGC